MATSDFTPFNCFPNDLAGGEHNLASDSIRVMLTETEPHADDTHVDASGGVCVLRGESAAQEIAPGDGYAKGGPAVTVSSSGQTEGNYKLVVATLLIPAPGNPLGPLRYAVIYNSSKGTSEARPAIGWLDYGEPITLDIGETLSLGFNQDDGFFTLTKVVEA